MTRRYEVLLSHCGDFEEGVIRDLYEGFGHKEELLFGVDLQRFYAQDELGRRAECGVWEVGGGRPRKSGALVKRGGDAGGESLAGT